MQKIKKDVLVQKKETTTSSTIKNDYDISKQNTMSAIPQGLETDD